jgi:hypothetical protein
MNDGRYGSLCGRYGSSSVRNGMLFPWQDGLLPLSAVRGQSPPLIHLDGKAS